MAAVVAVGALALSVPAISSAAIGLPGFGAGANVGVGGFPGVGVGAGVGVGGWQNGNSFRGHNGYGGYGNGYGGSGYGGYGHGYGGYGHGYGGRGR
jgi:hypothetical protein